MFLNGGCGINEISSLYFQHGERFSSARSARPSYTAHSAPHLNKVGISFPIGPVASPGFFRGDRPGHLKAITRPRRGSGGGAKAPRTVAKFHFLKRCKVLENEFIFQKHHHFFLSMNPIFLRKISKIEHISQEPLSFFERLFKNLNFSGGIL